MRRLQKLRQAGHRLFVSSLYRRPFTIPGTTPVISFTFDDFPLSAKQHGAPILEKYGGRGTYYAGLSLMGTQDRGVSLFRRQDVQDLAADGHEIGCHTYHHIDAQRISVEAYRASLMENQKQIRTLFPELTLESFSYPFGGITPSAKKVAGEHYTTCRTIWPGINKKNVDLRLLRANKLYSNTIAVADCKRLIDSNARARGWLIFYTHDVCEAPSPVGCTPAYLETVVRYAAESGTLLHPVGKAFSVLASQGKQGR